MEVRPKTVGVVGGMGPEATLDLFLKIIRNTPARRDQDHVHLVIDNYPQIPDRTAFILGSGESPLPYILDSVSKLQAYGVDAICMPCNTAHFFEPQIREFCKVPFISIVQSAVKTALREVPRAKRVGLVATRGVIVGKVYDGELERAGLEMVLPSDDMQDKVMDMIYSVKAGMGVEKAIVLQQVIGHLASKGADVIIAACTETPLLLPFVTQEVLVVDSTLALAKEVVSFALST